MVKEIRVGTNYYFNIKIPESPTETQTSNRSIEISTTTIYRVNGGTWQTRTGYFRFNFSWSQNKYLYYDGANHYMSENDIIEFVGVVDSTIMIDGDFFTKLVTDNAIPNPIEIELDTLNCEPRLVGKTSGTNLLFIDRIYGALREEINLLTPSITIQYNMVPNFNYVYISSLQRYYFVTNITCVRGNIYRIDLKVDVLCSYDSDIREQSGFISRNENDLSDRKLVDERRPLKDIRNIEYHSVMVDYPSPLSIKNITFFFGEAYDTTKHHWMVNTYSEMETTNYLSNVVSGQTYPIMGGSTRQPNDLIYFGSSEDMKYLTYGIIKNSTQEDYILSVVYYPFDITPFLNSTANYNLCAGSNYLNKNTMQPWGTTSDGQLTFYKFTRSQMPPLVLADFTITSPYDESTSPEKAYLNYEPFTEYELYVPFVGWVKVPAKEILNKRCLVMYALDITTGDGTMYITNYYDGYVIYSCSCRIGFKIPLSQNNQYQNELQRENNNLSMGIGLLGSSIATILGAISMNPLAVAGGVVSGVKSVGQTINKNSLLIPHTSVSYQSIETSIYGGYSVLLKITSKQEESIDSDVYGHTQGYPINQYDSLSNYTGYTEIPEMHYKPDSQTYITKTEIDEIVSLARDGIIL